MSTTASQMTAAVGSVPVPDPTLATISLLYREIEAVTMSRHREISALREIIEARLEGYDRAIALLHDDLSSSPSDTEKAVAHIREYLFAIIEERSKGIQTQFEERDVRQRRDAEQVKLAVDAALQAAKEAVQQQNSGFTLSIDKSDAAKTKEIDALGIRLTAVTAGLEGQIADLKERATRYESTALGRSASTGDMRSYVLMAVALVSVAIALAGYLASH